MLGIGGDMASKKIVMHLVNEKGAIICQSKTSKHKATHETWKQLEKGQRCGNCTMVLARREGPRRSNFATLAPRAASTRKDAACYTPRYGQVRS
jgi:hypothetical protein